MEKKLKSIINMPEDEALQMAKIMMFDEHLEGHDEDTWIGDGDFGGNIYTLEVGSRCFEGTLCINEATGEVYLLDDDNERLPIDPIQSKKVIDFLIDNDYEINHPNT